MGGKTNTSFKFPFTGTVTNYFSPILKGAECSINSGLILELIAASK